MTTEDDFQRALDRRRSDWQTRLVFADWLDERGDPRGPGYRALGLRRQYPNKCDIREYPTWDWWREGRLNECDVRIGPDTLPNDWFDLSNRIVEPKQHRDEWLEFYFRAAAENAAALAFAQLPAERQAELLNPTVKRVRRQRARK